MPVYNGDIRAYIGFLVDTVKGTTSRGLCRTPMLTKSKQEILVIISDLIVRIQFKATIYIRWAHRFDYGNSSDRVS